MTSQQDIDDLDSALAAAYRDRETQDVAKAKSRRGREKRASAEAREDGRSLRRTGRTSQLNIKVRADMKARLLSAVKRDGRSIAEIAEEIFEAWIAKGGRS
jgi:hypothetical protein